MASVCAHMHPCVCSKLIRVLVTSSLSPGGALFRQNTGFRLKQENPGNRGSEINVHFYFNIYTKLFDLIVTAAVYLNNTAI